MPRGPKRLTFRWLLRLTTAAVFAGAVVTSSVPAGVPSDRASTLSSDVAQFRLVEVRRGEFISVVKATGTVQPTSQVLVGTEASGQIAEILAGPNAIVEKGQVIARLNRDQVVSRREALEAEIDQAQAEVDASRAKVTRAALNGERAKAVLADQRARGEQADVLLAEGRRKLLRRQELFARSFAPSAEVDAARTEVGTAEAGLRSLAEQLRVAAVDAKTAEVDAALAAAEVRRATAALNVKRSHLRDADIELSRMEIRSPISGVVLQRNVEIGQTVAASFETPTLFTIAEDLRNIEIHATVDEADIGRVADGQRVAFTVQAYPDRAFKGVVAAVRLGAQTVQNVVTYTVVIAADNADRLLRPGMTAALNITTAEQHDALLVPNAALRWRPPGTVPPASGGRVFTVSMNGEPRPVDLQTGGSDGRDTRVLAGDLHAGSRVVVGRLNTEHDTPGRHGDVAIRVQ